MSVLIIFKLIFIKKKLKLMNIEDLELFNLN
jgi:hypothetical protein